MTEQTWERIRDWFRAVIKPRWPNPATFEKMLDEANELVEARLFELLHRKIAAESELPHHPPEVLDSLTAKVLEEAADVYIALVACLDDMGVTPQQFDDLVNAKMTINETRQWGDPDERGVLRHV